MALFYALTLFNYQYFVTYLYSRIFDNKLKIKVMETTFTANEIIICVANEDGTITPIGFSQSQASMVQMVLASLSNGEPFTKSNTIFEEVKKVNERPKISETQFKGEQWHYEKLSAFNCVIRDWKYDAIATVIGHNRDDYNETISKSKLIATAPQLLDSLNDLVVASELSSSSPSVECWNELIEKAKEVIGKATK